MTTCFAYLDAGTGSMILQAIMGGLAGALVLGRIAWRSLVDRFSAEHDQQPDAA